MPRTRRQSVSGKRAGRVRPGQSDEEEGAAVARGSIGEQEVAERSRVFRGGRRRSSQVQPAQGMYMVIYIVPFSETLLGGDEAADGSSFTPLRQFCTNYNGWLGLCYGVMETVVLFIQNALTRAVMKKPDLQDITPMQQSMLNKEPSSISSDFIIKPCRGDELMDDGT